MEKLVQLFIEHKVEKRLFASFGDPNKESFDEEDLQKFLKSPEAKMVAESGVDPQKLKMFFIDAFDKAYDKLKKKSIVFFDKAIEISAKK
ncbi:hypothetical protein IT401_00215 [Candidatus Nomurabacteria bacterium]|nr:hypothetical protein [Candidatus Nomurabacteria bacterium]